MRSNKRLSALLALFTLALCATMAFATTNTAGSYGNKGNPSTNTGATIQLEDDQTAATDAATNINTGFITTNAGNHNPKALNEATRFKDAATITGTPPDNLMAVAVTQKNGTGGAIFITNE